MKKIELLNRYENNLEKTSNHFLSAYPQNESFENKKKPNHFVLSIFGLTLVLTLFACTPDEDVTPPTLSSNEIGGVYGNNLILTDQFEDPTIADYLVTNTIEMENGAGFIVEPGVVIAFESGTRFQLGRFDDGFAESGYIQAEGTTDQPIVFKGAENISGFWNGIMIGCNSPDVRNILNHCVIENAGGDSEKFGIKITRCSNNASGLLSITNTTIINSAGVGLLSEGHDAINQFSNNVFEDNSAEAIIIQPQDFSHIDSETQFINNGIDGVTGITYGVQGRINDGQAHTWNKLNNAPYYISYSTYFDEGSLTVEAGTEIVFSPNTKLELREGSYINAVGTPEEPIIFRGTIPGEPSWNSIYLKASNTPNVLEYCEISEAGLGIIKSNTCHGEAAIGLNYWFGSGARASINNCTISNSAGCGIFTDGDNMSNLTQSNNTFIANASDDICN